MAVGDVKIFCGEKTKILTFGGVGFATATGASDVAAKTGVFTSFQVVATTTSGNVSGTVQIQVTNDDVTTGLPTNWLNFGGVITIASGASPQTGGFPLINTDVAEAAWRYVRANVTAITGTNAQIVVLMGN